MNQTQDLSFFHLLAQQGSLAATARELGVTPPAISKRLSLLEARLGTRLVNRTTRSMSLTAEGELYFSHAARILTQIDEVEQLITSSSASPKGLIRVNASLGFGRRHIGPALAAFFARYPEVQIQLEISDHPLDLAIHGFDLGIRFGSLPDAAFHARKIASNRRLLCASPLYLEKHGTPTRLAELQHHNCIFLRQNETPYGVWSFSNGGRTQNVKVHGALGCNDGEVALNWALEGFGILLRAEWDIARYVRSGRLRLVLEDQTPTRADVYAVYPQQLHLSARVRYLIDFLVERFASLDQVVPLQDPH
ncbi:Transcriptional regulator [Pseudomonas syringae pv. maculicola]|uniref:Transcriptional regulator, LysR family n=1 Tax=Pseudomonas savastanoi pv. glycinea TaxID=318 RepID=A0A3M4Z2M3_PSESG|nr:LysR family transcriptional regulator [Pseudomonas savastanoi]KPB88168.1 Transcriptional regulator [Pseudomonas syringae pv. maculicola]KPB39485.1 Transcriptional regulator [Pseudomonas savastanoi pv. phaseolicola]MBN4175143.1 HTH-type transcriptional regulator DmlR [Pseudomonas savastanoi pv. phaseolicola]RMM74364.1 Transcriptional regulator, LysR family [Pseudomonas savastanoi pv. glycinea]RMR95070.1 Transcriptional regulator, LysR family [Pseudomonas savastanoi pv. glycinea]